MSPEYRIRVHTLRKDGISDPVSQLIDKHLPDIGFNNVSNIRIGAAFRFILEAETNKSAREQTEQIFQGSFGQHYNPILDSFIIESVRKVRPKK